MNGNLLILLTTLTLWMAMNSAVAEPQTTLDMNVEEKFQNVMDKFDRLSADLLEQRRKQHNELKEILKNVKAKSCPPPQANVVLKEIEKFSKRQQDIVRKLETKCQSKEDLTSSVLNEAEEQNLLLDELNEVDNVNYCWTIYTKTLEELNSNFTVLENINKRLERFNDQYYKESTKHRKTLEKSRDVLKFLDKKDETRICLKSKEGKLLCAAGPPPTSCDNYNPAYCSDNKCWLANVVYGPDLFMVPCEDNTDGGGWIIIQRRINGSVDFYRNWSDYKMGFGDLDGEFWLGLDKLHALTSTLAPVELLVQLQDHKGVWRYAKYGQFAIGNETELYELQEIDDYNGNAGNSFSFHKGNKFSTKDKDNDASYSSNCAVLKRGGWWYNNCLWNHLNGFYYENGKVPDNKSGSGINWSGFHDYKYSLKFVQMMIRTRK